MTVALIILIDKVLPQVLLQYRDLENINKKCLMKVKTKLKLIWTDCHHHLIILD